MAILDEISEAVQKGNAAGVEAGVKQAIDDGMSAQEILDGGLMAAMNIIGPKFKSGEMFMPEVLMCARAMNAGSALLKPLLMESGAGVVGKGVIATVKGDMHDIGKNLCRMMVEGKGIEMADLGVDVDPQTTVKYVNDNPDCKVVLLSALLTTTLPALEDAVKALQDAGIQERGVKIMVGGAPVTQEFADKIGADAYTADAVECAEVARSFFD